MSSPHDDEIWVCVSGYFDPFHVGHLEYLEKARTLGNKLLVIVNSDLQAKLKKGKAFMLITRNQDHWRFKMCR